MKKIKTMALVCLTLLSVTMPSYGKDRINREKAIELSIVHNEVYEKQEKAEEEFLRSIRPIRNAAASQRGFQSDYHMIIQFMGDDLPDGFYMNFEEQFDHFYSMRVLEPSLLANLDQMRLERQRIHNRVVKQVDAHFLTLLEAEIVYENRLAYFDYLKEDFERNQRLFKQGNLSENALNRHKIQLAINEIEVAISKLYYDQAEMQMKHLLGIEEEAPVIWVADYRTMMPLKLEPVEHYIKNALENRIEIKTAEKRLESKRDVLALYKEIHYKLHERERTALEVLQSELALEKTRRDIEHEIRVAYLDVLAHQSAYESARDDFERQRASFTTMITLKDEGHQTEGQQKLKHIQLNEQHSMAMLAYMKYNTLQRHFEMAQSIGPTYE